MRLQKAIGEFLEDMRNYQVSPHTLRAYDTDLGFLMRALRGAKDEVASFTEELVKNLLTDERERGSSDQTIRRRLASVSTFGKWGQRKRLWAENPAAVIRRPPPPQKLPRPFSPAERERLLALDLPLRESALRAALYYTGARIESVLNLQVQDIQLSADPSTLGKVRFRVAKRKKQHVMDIAPELHTVLAEYLETHFVKVRPINGPRSFLFAWRSGKPFDRGTARLMTRAWGTRAGVVDCTPHRFRHNLATLLLELGVPLEVVCEVMDHESIETTRHYARVAPNRITSAIWTLAGKPPAAAHG